MIELTPKRIAFFTSVATSGIIALILGLVFLLIGVSNIWLYFFISVTLTFFASYLIFYYSIEQFIHTKIKLIYKSIHRQKTGNKKMLNDLDMNTDVIGNVNKEVLKWADESREEIQQLKEQAKFRREFIGNLAHELKTPLFSIQGYLFTLLEGGLEDEKINRDYLMRADRNLERLMDLVKDLDDITKLESGEMQLRLEKINIIELVRDTFNSLEFQAKKRKINLDFDKKYEKPIFVRADYGKIQQVIVNLIVNSINYGKEKGYTKVKFFDMDENILIEIEDNGIGISKEHLPRLFERFYRVDKSRARNHGGTGLGLAIVKHLIDAHKQTINARSEEGTGSTFSFTLKKA